MTQELFPDFKAKILLFGEYSLIVGSKALSMPLPLFSGRLKFAQAENLQGVEIQSNHNLRMFATAIKKMSNDKNRLSVTFNFNQLFNDLDNGLFFDSTIPQGYGLGSSGALVAAIFHNYAIKSKDRKDIFSNDEIGKLKNNFSIMESFFHGKSSGLDPLICYLSKPMVVKNDSGLQEVKIPVTNNKGSKVIFLLDTKLTGKTQPLVNYFVRQCDKKSYLDKIINELLPLNDQSIKAFLSSDTKSFKKLMQSLSLFTLNYFSPMIPYDIKHLWIKGLESKKYFFKLCGSGGGGMMIGYTEDLETTKKLISGFNIQPVYRF